MLTLTQLGDTFGELSHLLSQAIVVPFQRRRGQKSGRPSRSDRFLAQGRLVLFGAAELTDKQILQLIHLADGRQARFLVLALGPGGEAAGGERYGHGFRRFGVENLEIQPVTTEEEAHDPEVAAAVAAADLVLLGAGDAAGVVGFLPATPLHDALVAAYERGAVVAAPGPAGAALGSRAAAAEGTTPRILPGLALLPRLLVDPGFIARAQVARFLQVLAACPPGTLGLSLERGAGLVVQPGGLAQVTGDGSAFIVGGRHLAAGTPGAAAGKGLTVQTDWTVHALPPGSGYNFRNRRPVAGRSQAIWQSPPFP